MCVSKDKYELPTAIADTQAELSKIIGVDANCIASSMSHAKKRGGKCQYVAVEIDEGD